jgi:hypothetical protein
VLDDQLVKDRGRRIRVALYRNDKAFEQLRSVGRGVEGSEMNITVL